MTRRRTFRVLLKHLNGHRGQEYALINENRTSRKNSTDVAGTIGPGVGEVGAGARDALTDLLRREAATLLATASRHEVGAWLEDHAGIVDEDGHRQMVRNGFNVPNKLPKTLHGAAKDLLLQIWMAPTKATAERSFDLFVETHKAKYASAAECLSKDREHLLAFYDFPAEHRLHIRTTNPIQSVFATVRLRTEKTKGSGSRVACLTMVFKLTESASKKWRFLNGSELIPQVIAGVVFVDGVTNQIPERAAA